MQPKTLRDEFAMAALQAIIDEHCRYGLVPATAAKLAYEYADAMLKEREKGKE